MAQYATFTKFYSPEDAQALISFLQQHGIPCKLEHEVNQLDKVFLSEGVDPMFALQIPTDRFPDLNGLLAEQAKFDMLQPGFEHVLQSSSTEELREIINDPSSWNAYDIQVAASLLAERTHVPTAVPAAASTFQPLKLELIWIILGYLACLLGASYFFQLAIGGFLAGLVVNQAKKTLKNGTTVKMYDKTSRMHGRIMMVLATICLAISFTLFYLASHR
ncbi:hypothetical protein A3860_05765 [Niastella vici]|uniref:DUF2007 domain-containing protein n=1 Tax=Niastella vici TaxID=1703345 RepID=A0A1V9FSC3_9BACT|nr:hypothetical protein [Niastella vici]OQP61218.1 hypothetical protein A3860_05765 [Niastella vici]